MSYYPEPDSHVKDKAIVIFDLSQYTTKKELEHATAADTSDLVAKKDFIALKAAVDKFDINKLVHVPTNLNSLKAKVDHLDVGKLETLLVNLTKLRNVIANEIVKNTKFNKLKAKVIA